ncbi:MAG: hypothetical protein KJO08_03775 [Gammaproteobacteria bacterium]|nr:hypothetical protein [Gammaproteobacteria bacterium]
MLNMKQAMQLIGIRANDPDGGASRRLKKHPPRVPEMERLPWQFADQNQETPYKDVLDGGTFPIKKRKM